MSEDERTARRDDGASANDRKGEPPADLDPVGAALRQFTASAERQLKAHLTHFARQIGKETDHKIAAAMERLERLVAGRGVETVPLPEETQDATLNDYAVQLYYKNELEQAAQLLEEATATTPDSVESWNNLAMVYSALNQTEKAVKAFQKAVELDPNRLDLLNNKGVMALLGGQPEQALSFLEAANESNPQQVPTLLNLAQAYQASGRFNRAIQAWKMVLAIDPHQEEATQNLRQFYQ